MRQTFAFRNFWYQHNCKNCFFLIFILKIGMTLEINQTGPQSSVMTVWFGGGARGRIEEEGRRQVPILGHSYDRRNMLEGAEEQGVGRRLQKRPVEGFELVKDDNSADRVGRKWWAQGIAHSKPWRCEKAYGGLQVGSCLSSEGALLRNGRRQGSLGQRGGVSRSLLTKEQGLNFGCFVTP